MKNENINNENITSNEVYNLSLIESTIIGHQLLYTVEKAKEDDEFLMTIVSDKFFVFKDTEDEKLYTIIISKYDSTSVMLLLNNKYQDYSAVVILDNEPLEEKDALNVFELESCYGITFNEIVKDMIIRYEEIKNDPKWQISIQETDISIV